MTLQQDRDRRLREDEALARGFEPAIKRGYRTEQQSVTEKDPVSGVSTSLWVGVMTVVWLSDPVLNLWGKQQAALGTDITITTATIAGLKKVAAEHGATVAAANRSKLTTLFDGLEDATTAVRRSALRSYYQAQVTDQAGALAFTEALQASETIRFDAARNSAETAKYRMRKTWRTMGDSRVRPSHQRVNGQHRLVNHRGWGGRPGKFLVGGALLAHPRDPSGPPGEVINCRCFLQYKRIRKR